jgi:arylsulfatase A-like enzyme
METATGDGAFPRRLNRALGASLLLLAPSLMPLAADPALAAPNFVVVMTDDQEFTSLSKMPQINNLLVRRGALFTNHVASIPLCAPSRAAFLTGRYGHNNGVSSNGLSAGAVFQEGRMLPMWLQRAGYTTAMFGKYVNFYGREFLPATHVPVGWSEWNGIPVPWMHRYLDFTINQNGTLRAFPRTDAGYQTDVLTRRAVAFIAAQEDNPAPFYVQLSYIAPHRDIDSAPPNAIPAPRHEGAFASEPLPTDQPSFNEADVSDKPSFTRYPALTGTTIANMRDQHRLRLASLLAVDEGVRAIIRVLMDIGKIDDTYIIFVSDNGWLAGQHRIPSGKQGYYEEAIRVPLVVRGPGVPQGVTRGALATHVDLAPTIADLAGAIAKPVVDGRSLRPVLAGGTVWRSAVLIDGKFVGPTGINHFFDAIRSNRYLYVVHATSDRELYDLQSDPFQIANLAAAPAYAGVQADLAGKLATLRGCAGITCWITAPDVAPSFGANRRAGSLARNE